MKVTLLLILLMSSFRVVAQERYDFYKGIRQMGMGGAAVAVVNDETALLSNPAGLGKLRDYFVTIIDPDMEVGVNTSTIAKTDVLGMLDPQKALNACKLNPDVHLHERGQVFPSLVVPNFGVGFFGKYQVDAQDVSKTSQFAFDYTNDYALVFGFDFRFLNGIIKVGTNARIINRTEVHNSTIADNSLNLNLATLASSGVGVGSDSGIIITAPVAYLPTLAGVYRDVGRTAYTMRKGLSLNTAAAPDSTAGTVDVAFAIHPILGRRTRTTWTAEYQDVLTTGTETDQMRRVHAGVELNYADAIFLRGGLNQRYWTAGLELSMGNYQFQAASYGEDIGIVGTPVEDRRYEVKFAFRF